MRAMKKTNSAFAGTSVQEMIPLTSLFDPDSDPDILIDCLEQYSHRISAIRVLIGHNEQYKIGTTSQTILAARNYNVPTLTRVESSKLVITRGILPIYLDLCGETGVERIQFRKTSLQPEINPREVVALADDRNLDVQFEIDEAPSQQSVVSHGTKKILDNAMHWLDAGVVNLVAGVTRQTIDTTGRLSGDILNLEFAEQLAGTFGLHAVMFKAPTSVEQHALLDSFGDETHLCEVPFGHVSRVERMRCSWSPTASFSAERDISRPIRRSDERTGI